MKNTTSKKKKNCRQHKPAKDFHSLNAWKARVTQQNNKYKKYIIVKDEQKPEHILYLCSNISFMHSKVKYSAVKKQQNKTKKSSVSRPPTSEHSLQNCLTAF